MLHEILGTMSVDCSSLTAAIGRKGACTSCAPSAVRRENHPIKCAIQVAYTVCIYIYILYIPNMYTWNPLDPCFDRKLICSVVGSPKWTSLRF